MMISKMIATTAFLALATSSAPPDRTCTAPQTARDSMTVMPVQSGKQWCCCGGCCGYAVNCAAIPGCTSC
ncbi:MAG: hypothetical protein AAF311_07645 [Pseudomonadota bacterium]